MKTDVVCAACDEEDCLSDGALGWTVVDVELVREALLTLRQLTARANRAGDIRDEVYLAQSAAMTSLIADCDELMEQGDGLINVGADCDRGVAAVGTSTAA